MKRTMMVLALLAAFCLPAPGCRKTASPDSVSGKSGPPSQAEIEAMRSAHLEAAEAARTGEPAAQQHKQ